MSGWIHRIPVGHKLTLLSVFSTAGALLVASLSFIYLDYRSMQGALVDQIELQADLLVRSVQPAVESEDEPLADESILVLAEIPAVAGAEILFDNGRRLAGFGELPSDHNPPHVIRREMTLSDGRKATLSISARPVFSRERTLRSVEVLTLVSVLAMLVSYLLSIRLEAVIALPIEQLARLMRDVSERGDYTVRAKIEAQDEVGDLVDVFNEMITTIEWGELELKDAKNALEHNVDLRTEELEEEIRRRQKIARELIEARDQAQSLAETKAEFLANMSHEIRTPLIGVIGMAELLQDTPLDDLQQQYAETLVGSSGHLLKLVNDILDISKLNKGAMNVEYVDFDLADLSYEVAGLLYPQARDKSVDIALGYPSNVPRQVKGDPARMRQVLTNLIGNAVKFTNEGSIALRYELLERENERIRLRISVEDTGVGIADDRVDSIFDQFVQADASTTRRYGGSGLGLAISKNLVELMDGTIQVRSTLGVGSRFDIEITFGEAQRQHRLAWPQSDWRNMNAVLAMKDGLPAQLLRSKLEEFGIVVECVEQPGSREFQRRVKHLGSGDRAPSIVLADAGDEPERTMEIMRGLAADLGDRSPWFVLLADPVQIRGDSQLHRMVGGSVLRKPARHADIVKILDMASQEEGMPVAELARPNVLLAEDNVVNQRICGAMLERCGFQVRCVSNGEEAVEAAATGDYELILMDCHMPRMDGLRATRAIRLAEGAAAQTLVIGLLSSERSALEDACRRAGMNDLLSKPLTMAKIETLCERHFPLVTP